MWPFVRGKARVRWVWAALDTDTRQVVAMAVGDRSEDTARRPWAAVPPAYRDRAIICTDFWSADLAVVPVERHAAGGKEAGLTCHVERFWSTARQRCPRLMRTSLPFSKCVESHVGALWYFLRHDNSSLL